MSQVGQEIIHSIVLIVVVALGFIFPQTVLARYDLQVGALLFIILFISRRHLSKKNVTTARLTLPSRLLEAVIFTLIVLIIVNTTGGVSSPYFFLLHFLVFSLSLLLEPLVSIILTLTLVLFYLFSTPGSASNS